MSIPLAPRRVSRSVPRRSSRIWVMPGFWTGIGRIISLLCRKVTAVVVRHGDGVLSKGA